jgi:hypothetical protein
MFLLALWRGRVAEASLVRLERADVLALLLELVIFAVFLASLGALLFPLLRTWHGVLLVAGTLILGVLAPLALYWATRARGAAAAAVFSLVGGFVLRYATLTTPPELLARAPEFVPGQMAGVTEIGTPGAALLPGFSPEDGRQPGGGPGGDAGNRAGDVRPRSKVYHDE